MGPANDHVAVALARTRIRTNPAGAKKSIAQRLLGYYTDDGKLIYAGRVGTGMPVKVLADLRRRLDPLARKTSSLSAPPPRSTRFGSLESIGSSRSSSPRSPI